MSFLGFANFYCHFIYGYSEITVPLTWKDVPWVFSNDCQKSFEKLKKAFVTTLVLTHWILDTPIMVETDASDYTLAAVLSIQTPDGDYHPVAFHSQTFKDAETNYNIGVTRRSMKEAQDKHVTTQTHNSSASLELRGSTPPTGYNSRFEPDANL